MGNVKWPGKWTVFLPIDNRERIPIGIDGKAAPARVELAGDAALTPLEIRTTPGERIDFNQYFSEQKVGNVAWLYSVIESPVAQQATIGAGADWWFTAWLNGEEVLATPESGNGEWPPTANDFTATVNLNKGGNLLVFRYVTGGASAFFASGGPREIRTSRARIGGQQDPHRFNRPVPFIERLPFPYDEQATASAEIEFTLPPTNADLRAGELAGLVKMPKRQLELQEMHGRPSVGDTEYRFFPFDPVKILLSKDLYPYEDQHIEVVLWTSPPEGIEQSGDLEVILKDADGSILSTNVIDQVSATGWFFAVGIPPSLEGQQASLEVIWRQDGVEVERAEEHFSVAPATHVATSGSVPIDIINKPGAVIENAPMTVGVPFPHGALHCESNVRLIDEHGAEVPLQTRVTGRWSRFGPIKWLLCDFTTSLNGQPRQFKLEFGPAIERPVKQPIMVDSQSGHIPALDAGRLKVNDRGIEFDPAGDGNFIPVLGPDALIGEYVIHEDGRHFKVPASVTHTIEELGSEKAVIRRTGWYVDDQTGDRFCNFITRIIFHRDSPVVRIYHTWVFTGDSNHDRIRDMGWRFHTPADFEPEGFLTSFQSGEWVNDSYLVQFDFDKYALGSPQNTFAGRTPGVLSARIGDSRLLVGVKDFWQNFPSELAFADDAIYFHNWPRNNLPASTESPVPAGQAFKLRYAHEGQVLNFRAPDEYADGPIYDGATLNGREEIWERGNAGSVNAQGVARTEELVLYFTPAAVPAQQSVAVMQGFNDESLRAIADPVWMAASGAFGRIHHQDFDNHPQQEELYELIAHAPARWNERLGAYGMWVHGDFPADSLHLRNQSASPRRTWKKGHHGWPYKWTAFARSGDPELLKYAEAGSRQMVDGNFRHFADPDIHDDRDGQGWTGTGLFPWHRSGNRSISQDVDYLWHHYYLTGFPRTKDVALLWGEIVKQDTARGLPGRISVSQMYYYLDSYLATFDPWFLVAAHELAGLHREIWDGEIPDYFSTDTIGHFWKPADYNFYTYTGKEAQKSVAKRIATSWSSPWAYTNSWNRLDVPFIEESAAAWFLTGDDYHLGRIAGFMDSAAIQVFDGPEPEYLRGSSIRSGGAGTALELFTGWYLQHFPYGLYAIEQAGGGMPDPIPNPFFQRPVAYPTVEVDGKEFSVVTPPRVLFKRTANTDMPIIFDTWRYQKDLVYDYTVAPIGGNPALEGQWTADGVLRMDLPAEAPIGVYEIDRSGLDPFTGWRALQHQFVSGLVQVPATPHDVPEVLAFERTEEGTVVGPSLYESQYWFLVPDSVEQFEITFVGNGGRIWNADGNIVWSAWHVAADGGDVNRAVVPVPPDQRGRLWRITHGGANAGFTVDPAIPPYFSVSRAKWFNPEKE